MAPAHAAAYLFTYTGDAIASWTLPSSPVPYDFDLDYFETDDIIVTYNGITDYDFYNFMLILPAAALHSMASRWFQMETSFYRNARIPNVQTRNIRHDGI